MSSETYFWRFFAASSSASSASRLRFRASSACSSSCRCLYARIHSMILGACSRFIISLKVKAKSLISKRVFAPATSVCRVTKVGLANTFSRHSCTGIRCLTFLICGSGGFLSISCMVSLKRCNRSIRSTSLSPSMYCCARVCSMSSRAFHACRSACFSSGVSSTSCSTILTTVSSKSADWGWRGMGSDSDNARRSGTMKTVWDTCMSSLYDTVMNRWKRHWDKSNCKRRLQWRIAVLRST
mmetsp:Transcript_4368/g.7669  ORF Transcript_4368/g.7669 Transcript_4368/m.7669 type:complete len:240 (+) Transcript_4368:663-1382(+)